MFEDATTIPVTTSQTLKKSRVPRSSEAFATFVAGSGMVIPYRSLVISVGGERCCCVPVRGSHRMRTKTPKALQVRTVIVRREHASTLIGFVVFVR